MIENKQFQHEWYIYSSVFIVCALSFISINISTGNTQVLAVAISAVLGGAFALSDNWKNLPIQVHKHLILMSIFTILVFAVSFKLIKKSNP